MKIRPTLIVAACAALFTASNAHAYIFLQPDGTARDNRGVYWIADLTMFASMTFAQQIAAIDVLDFAGRTDWRMASLADIQALFADPNNSAPWMQSVFTPTVVDGTTLSWGARFDEPGNQPDTHQTFVLHRTPHTALRSYGASLFDSVADSSNGAMVLAGVPNGSSSHNVPDSGSSVAMLAACVGLLTLIGRLGQPRAG